MPNTPAIFFNQSLILKQKDKTCSVCATHKCEFIYYDLFSVNFNIPLPKGKKKFLRYY